LIRSHCNFVADGASIKLPVMTQIKHIKRILLLVVMVGVLGVVQPHFIVNASDNMNSVPVLVELYTSEGCSSCPPADAFLQELDQQPVAGAQMIVLSEHVDYWNHIGWKDPFSSSYFSDRQSAYGRRFGLEGVYTPQMVVDGAEEFVGSDQAVARKAFAKALKSVKISVQLSSISFESNAVHAHIEAAALPSSQGKTEADVYVVVALNRAESQVARGENAGRTLAHTAVVESMTKVAAIHAGQACSKDVQLKLKPGFTSDNLRLVAFVQAVNQGLVLGATEQKIR
jgi:hypothetical protein